MSASMQRSRRMISTGGGGGLPSINSPMEAVVMVVVVAVIAWAAFKFFSS